MAAELQSVLHDMRTTRRAIFGELANTPEKHLNKMTDWFFGHTPARNVFLCIADHDEEHGLQLENTLRSMLGWQPTYAQQILGAAEVTRGALLGAVVGLADADLDVVPVDPAGEWPLRQTLAHAIATEHSYRMNTLYSVKRQRAGEPLGELPGRGDESEFLNLSLDAMLIELDSARDQTIAELSGLSDDDLRAPTVWSGIDVNVNYRLMRFSHHEREHTAQIQKWRVQAGKPQTDAQRLLGLAWQTHGVLRSHLVGVPEEIFNQDPSNGEWSPRQILAHVADDDGYFKRMIDAAV